MTLEQIRGMSDEEMSAAIAGTQGFEIAGEDERNSQYHFSSEKGRIYGFLVDKRGRRRGKLCQIPNYTHDLNAAMRLVPQGETWEHGFDDCLRRAMYQTTSDFWWYWSVVCNNKPRALCEAYLLWKAGDK